MLRIQKKIPMPKKRQVPLYKEQEVAVKKICLHAKVFRWCDICKDHFTTDVDLLKAYKLSNQLFSTRDGTWQELFTTPREASDFIFAVYHDSAEFCKCITRGDGF